MIEKNKLYFIIIALGIFILSTNSCKNKYNVVREEDADEALSFAKAKNLEGVYRVDSNAMYFGVYDLIQNKMPGLKYNPQDYWVKVEVANKNQLNLSYYRVCEPFRKKKLKGEFVDGYFVVKKKIEFFKPYFPLIYGPATIKRKIGLSKTGNLVFTKSALGYFMLLVAPMGKGLSLKDYEFTQVKESEQKACFLRNESK